MMRTSGPTRFGRKPTAKIRQLFFLEVVVVHLDAKDNDATDGGHEVCDEQRPDDFRLVKQSLQHKADAANSHHQEGGQCDAVGVTGLDGLDGLW